jgi:hypothetical protein
MFRLGKVTILIALLLGSCSKDLPINRETTVLILTDAMRLEASQQVAYNYMLLPDSIWKLQYDFILAKYQVSAADFENTMEYYKQHGKEFANIMTDVVAVLEEESNKEFKR